MRCTRLVLAPSSIPGWLGIQREYDPNFYRRASWERAQEALREEREILATVSAAAGDEREFEELAYERFDKEAPFSGYLELGVTALCIALNAAGCVTASSCRGHAGGPQELPQVLLACDSDRTSLLWIYAALPGAESRTPTLAG